MKARNNWLKTCGIYLAINSIVVPEGDACGEEEGERRDVGMIESDEEKIRFTCGVKSLPWLILTDSEHIIHAEGFSLSELSENLSK